MANRPETERNQNIMKYWEKGYRHVSIAKMFKMKESAVSMVIMRERRRRKEQENRQIGEGMQNYWIHQADGAE